MSQSPSMVSYASAPHGPCQLCHKREAWKKPLYGYPVCKKCYYGFANRRQLAYIIDSILYAVVTWPLGYFILQELSSVAPTPLALELLSVPIALIFVAVFAMRDGFGGRSPGRRLTGIKVVDDPSGRPISFVESLKRNCFFFVGATPYFGPLGSLIVVLTIAIQLNKGYRMGDRFAKTRVIWTKYARSPVFGGDDMLCHTCGYDLTGNVSGICPECGTKRDARPQGQPQAVPTPVVAGGQSLR